MIHNYLRRNENEKTEQSAVELLEKLLLDGYRKSASDIHIEPREDSLMVRIRLDGMLVEHMKLNMDLHPSLSARVKIICGMDIAEKRLPQDGHCKIKVDDVEMDLRASSVPTIYGEKIVLRFLNTQKLHHTDRKHRLHGKPFPVRSARTGSRSRSASQDSQNYRPG